MHFEQTCFQRGLHSQFGMAYKAMLLLVLIRDVRFVNVVADIATRITGEEISVSYKHLDQNERLDDFGSRTRPQFFFWP